MKISRWKRKSSRLEQGVTLFQHPACSTQPAGAVSWPVERWGCEAAQQGWVVGLRKGPRWESGATACWPYCSLLSFVSQGRERQSHLPVHSCAKGDVCFYG